MAEKDVSDLKPSRICEIWVHGRGQVRVRGNSQIKTVSFFQRMKIKYPYYIPKCNSFANPNVRTMTMEKVKSEVKSQGAWRKKIQARDKPGGFQSKGGVQLKEKRHRFQLFPEKE